MKKQEDIERSIITTYRKDIWRKFNKAICDYNLVEENDKIAVCISGGKDSFLMAKCFQELMKHGKVKFSCEFIMMDPGYKNDTERIISLSKKLGIELKVFKTNIFEVINNIDVKMPCFMCAKMRRGYLYSYAQKLGCNKIALGHHFNDVIETTLLDMFYNGRFEGMLPNIESTNFPRMKLIRPLYLVKECSIINWMNYNEIKFITPKCGFKVEDSKRLEIKELINKLKKSNKFLEDNILKSLENINLNQVLGYYKDNIKYFYLDNYESKK